MIEAAEVIGCPPPSGKYKRRDHKFVDRSGMRYGRWLVIRPADPWNGRCPRWLCRCDCGTERSVLAMGLARGTSTSCGCRTSERMKRTEVTHGMSLTRVYGIWASMKYRCENPKSSRFKDYGGRGIKVCERWQSFENFFADMGHPPTGMSIDRQENNGDYEPGNCRWATRKQQQRNTRRSPLFTHRGQQMTLREWADTLGLPFYILRHRVLRAGWDIDRALTEPVKHRVNRPQ